MLTNGDGGHTEVLVRRRRYVESTATRQDEKKRHVEIVPNKLTWTALNKAEKTLEDNHHDNYDEKALVVLENVDLVQYDKFMEKYEGHLRPAFLCDKVEGGKVLGKVVVQELPSEIHEVCSHTISDLIVQEINILGNDPRFANSTLRIMTSPKYSLGNNRKEPDLAIKCKSSGLLTLVAEVAWKNESLPRLRAELELWKLHDEVRIIIGVKIFPSKRMILIKITRQANGGWNQVELEFGDIIADPPNLDLSIADLYFGSPIPLALAGIPVLSISLLELRNNIFEVLP